MMNDALWSTDSWWDSADLPLSVWPWIQPTLHCCTSLNDNHYWFTMYITIVCILCVVYHCRARHLILQLGQCIFVRHALLCMYARGEVCTCAWYVCRRGWRRSDFTINVSVLRALHNVIYCASLMSAIPSNIHDCSEIHLWEFLHVRMEDTTV